MNRRNASYILPHNPRKHYPRVDDKLLTKQICEKPRDSRAADLRSDRAARETCGGLRN